MFLDRAGMLAARKLHLSAVLSRGHWEDRRHVMLTEAEQAVFDHLVAEPGPVRSAGPASPGWSAATVSSGGEGADPATVQFRRTRAFPSCQLHSVTFGARDGSPCSFILRTWQDAGGTWAVGPIGGGGGPGPHRSSPWVNFAAQLGADSFAGGGEVIGDGAERAHRVRLTFADGIAVEDTVENGVVLFFTSPGGSCPARVEIFSDPGEALASYDEFGEFA
jgi:hypothetical protein